ncbi:uncharacterized protein LOC125653494 [Ostrea edulis]|uniref:uncharacterized protein LOC125653494 n=1 Tax=Ostrea edulis TaxID=37623 RepID=UPI0024AF88C3|nr:uncharacterized protein LOC125653494 [Ostrea edulis]
MDYDYDYFKLNPQETLYKMDADAKTNYIADEIMDLFRPSRENGHELALVVIGMTILLNFILFISILAEGNIKKPSNLLEIARGLSEVLLLVSITIQNTKNMYNTTEPASAVSGFAVFWFFSMLSVCLGLMKSFTGFVRYTGRYTMSGSFLLANLVIFALSAFIAFIVLCVVYVANVLGFVILVCIFYYLPFMGMWLLDGLRILHLRTHSVKNILEMETLIETNPAVPAHEQEVQFQKPMTGFGMFIALLYGFCHTVAFAMVTIVITRVAWVFFRPVSAQAQLQLQSIPGSL